MCQWLADVEVEPARWPVLGRLETDSDWRAHAMSTAEFIYRVIADPEFQPLGVARELGSPFYWTAAEAAAWYAGLDPRTTG